MDAMLIQCHSCNTKYRLNLERIPKRKTFVRCKNCGTPIYIDPTEESEPLAAVLPPQPDFRRAPAAAGPESGLVVCPSCQSRYRIAEESLRRPGIKLKCTQCGHLFPPPGVVGRPPAPPPPPREAPPPPEEAPHPPAPGLGEMPLPDDRQMDTLFDDLRPEPSSLNLDRSAFEPSGGPFLPPEVELGALPEEHFPEEPPVPDSEQAYLDAVVFRGDDEPILADPGTGVPESQKSRFFLSPKAFSKTGEPMGEESKDRPPPDTVESQDGEEPSLEGAVPPLHDEVPALPPMSVASVEAPRSSIQEKRAQVPGQDPTKATERRMLYLLAAASVAVLVGAGVWGYFLATAGGEKPAYSVQIGRTHQLALQDDLEGHYVSNVPSGKRLFVVNGEVENLFPGESKVRWIRLKGVAFADRGQTQPLGLAFAYAGNLLKDSELTHWDLPAIKAYHGFINGRQDLNFEIPPAGKVPYQLVFAAIGDRVERTVAEIVSYHLDGQAVFIDQP